MNNYLNVTKEDSIPSSKLKYLDDGISMLIKHLSNPEARIMVQVDADCDGYTSSSLLLNYLNALLPSATPRLYWALHDDKAHGIMMKAIQPNTTLVIVPDAGSNELKLHQELAENGIDVLVLDHHIVPNELVETSPACIINNQLWDFPNRDLSGAGVVYKFCQAIDEKLGCQLIDNFSDLAAVGVIGDMMDLRNLDTRFLIQEGMTQLRNPFLKAMSVKNEYSMKGEVNPFTVSFYIVPFINAMTRSGTIAEKEVLFKSMLEWEAKKLVPSTKRGAWGEEETIVEQAIRTCTNVKARQERVVNQMMADIETLIAAAPDLMQHKVLIIRADKVHIERNVAGLAANKLMAKLQRPVTILSPVTIDGRQCWAGSARGYDKSELKDFRGFCEASGMVEYAQGHENAFGLCVAEENFDSFVEYCDTALANIDFTPCYNVDFIYSNQDINPAAILQLGGRTDLWGQGIECPLIAIENIAVTTDKIAFYDNRTTLMRINLGNGVTAIKRYAKREEYEELCSEGCVKITIVGKPSVNHYYESVTPQIEISEIEILAKQDWYF